MSRLIVKLAEWRTQDIPGVSLSDLDRQIAARLNGIKIDELRSGIRISTTSWVGIVRFETFEIHVSPKLAGDNSGLIDMISFTHGLDALKRLQAVRELLLEPSTHLLDLVALLFAETCEQILREGFLHDYVELEHDLPVVRGRLLVSQQVRRRFGQVDHLECRYDDHVSDIVENQILLTALTFCRSRVTHPTVRLRIRHLHTLFSSICGELRGDWIEVRNSLLYHRLNERYRNAHELAWLLLGGAGVSDVLATGPTNSFAFMIDMNKLFEAFVEQLIRHLLEGTPYEVHAQHQSRSLVWNVTDNRSYATVIPDVLIESPAGSRLTIDAKYKLYDDRKVSPEDVYQNFLYAYTHQQDTPSIPPLALLLYPSVRVAGEITKLQIRNRSNQVQANLYAFGINVGQVLAELHQMPIGPNCEILQAMIHKVL